MRTLDRLALGVSVAAVALAGCGSFQTPLAQRSFPQATVQLAANNFAGEKFTSSYVSAKCLLTPGGPELAYTATGSATGPLPGTFSTSGTVLDFALRETFEFSETFEVQSGTQTFSGTVEKSHGAVRFNDCVKKAKGEVFKAKRVRFGADGSRGRSSIDYSKLQFHESFL
ncbi:MAG: hypothetical protein ABSF08_14125 [Candidatus Cybelea sp.]|jgi:hypothetical protein